MPLHSRAAKASVRRIFVREPIMIPADFTVNVPVRMAFVNLSTPPSDWVTEPKEVKPGLLAARTLCRTMIVTRLLHLLICLVSNNRCVQAMH